MSAEVNLIEKKETLLANLKLIPQSEYRKVLREHLPPDCFKKDRNHALVYFVCMSLYIAGLYGIISFEFFPLKILISFLMGIMLASLTFFLHDLFHGSIFNSKKIQYLCGLSIGLFNLFAPLFWKRVHNFHHARTGDLDDPDRSYTFSEKPKNILTKIAYKTRLTKEAFHPLISFFLMSTGFFWYFLNNIAGIFFPQAKVTNNKCKGVNKLFNSQEKIFILAELLAIFLFQAFLLLFVSKGNFTNYLLLSLVPVGIAHFIAMLYIHTNHFLSPLTGKIDDPLLNSLSLKNPWFVDKIFLNFSHHTEHHLFPQMSPKHYPKVRKLLLHLYPDRFNLLPMHKAVSLLMSTPRIYKDNVYLITEDSSKIMLCPVLQPNFFTK